MNHRSPLNVYVWHIPIPLDHGGVEPFDSVKQFESREI